MIASLRGRLRRRLEGRVILESAGVGYEVVLPPVVARGLDGLVAGDGADAAELELVIYYHATRDQPRPVLIGFARDLEREFFERLITVKDVGPLVAARALVAPIADIADAIVRKDERFLRRLPGIGPQKCRNIVAQLEGKVAKYALLPREEAPEPPPRRGVATRCASLVRDILVRQMGLRPGEADQAIREALARRPDIDAPEALFEEIYRAAGSAGPARRAVGSGDRCRRGAWRRAVSENLLSRTALADEAPFERALRPQRLDEYIGQREAVESLRVSVEAARQRGECLDHVLLYGPPGLGKTTLAIILANEMASGLKNTSGPALERGDDLMGVLTSLEPRDVLFVDEIHRLPRVVEELFYPAMEDFEVNFVMERGMHARTMRIPLKPFTLVGATTRPGMLSAPLRERFGIFHHLDFYDDEELARIVVRSAGILGLPIEPGGRPRSRGAPAARRASPTASCGACGTSRRSRATAASAAAPPTRRSPWKASTRAGSTASTAGSSRPSSSSTAAGRSGSRPSPRRSTTTRRRWRSWSSPTS